MKRRAIKLLNDNIKNLKINIDQYKKQNNADMVKHYEDRLIITEYILECVTKA